MSGRPLRLLVWALLPLACSSVLGIEEGQLDPALGSPGRVLTSGQDSRASAACIPFDNQSRLTKPFDHLLPLPD